MVSRETAGKMKKNFETPPAECMPSYFWYLNTELNHRELRRQLRDMAAHGVRNVCPHPWPPEFRPERMPSDMRPEYLSPDYFRAYRTIATECAALGMNCYLYDEGGWPSGGAAGRVYNCEPEKWAQLYWTKHGVVSEPGVPEKAAPYPNALIREAAEKFLELTHERYRKHIGSLFGTTFRFVFMDEPTMPTSRPGERLTWCPDLAAEFQRRKGYDITPFLPQLIEPEGLEKIRIDFHDVTSRLFVERFLLPIRKWCRKNGLLSGGHFSNEDRPENSAFSGYGHILRALRALDLPGVDAIWRQLFPGVRTHVFPKYASSVARQAGRKFALAEIFAVYGNGITPMQQKFLIDYMLVRGVNALVFSKIAFSNRGSFLSGCRPHLGPADPLWKYARMPNEYAGRISFMLTRGRPVVSAALYHDVRSVWAGGEAKQTAIQAQNEYTEKLLSQQCDFDFVDDDVLATAKSENGTLVIGKMRYPALLIPSTQFMAPEAAARLKNLTLNRETPRPLLGVEPAAPALRVCKRLWGKRAIYFCVNESDSVLELTLTFDESEPIACWNPENGEKYAAGIGCFRWRFEPFGSALFVTGTTGKKHLREWKQIQELNDWTLKPVRRHIIAGNDFQIIPCRAKAVRTSLGPWNELLGEDFSGDAVYTAQFETGETDLWLDLGKVEYSASVKLNGVSLGERFWGPFRFDLKPGLKTKGLNRLEVTVTNTLANALSPEDVKNYIEQNFPPLSPYEDKQREFERDSLSSGLTGPVRLFQVARSSCKQRKQEKNFALDRKIKMSVIDQSQS